MAEQKKSGNEHLAYARATNVPISTRDSIEVSKYLRYKSVNFAKSFLADVVALKKAVPFKTFIKDLGHKPGMSSGKYPKKAAVHFLKLLRSVEANAQVKGLDTSNLKIIKLLANKASIPSGGGRLGRGTKRTHLEIAVREGKEGKSKKDQSKSRKQNQEKTIKENKKEVRL